MAYLGQSLTEGTRRVYNYVATASQTTFNAIYGVGAVDVYQNGVLLAEADYVATTGTTVVLGTGAALNDEITIVCHNTFSVADTVSASSGGTFNGDVTFDQNVGIGTGSPSNILHVSGTSGTPVLLERTNGSACTIAFKGNATTNNPYLGANGNDLYFNTGTSEAMRIDSSGNLLVGTTSSSSNTAGIKLTSAGTATFVRSGVQPVYVNRLTNDGDLAVFAKDGATVGSIGTVSGDLSIGSDDAYLFFDGGANKMVPASTSTGGASDGLIELGASDRRFKDLYLSGNITMGGRLLDNTHIFANAANTTEYMRIDSSGNLLVGKTSSSSTTAGAEIFGSGYQFLTNDGVSLYLTRPSTDGEMLRFLKGTAAVGSIGVSDGGDRIYFGGKSTNRGIAIDSSASVLLPSTNTGGLADGLLGLGTATARFTDLYLSGGAYLGGTTSSNKLDDYETGTFTSSTSSNNVTSYGTFSGRYMKVGKMVHLSGKLSGIAAGTGHRYFVFNAPFPQYTNSHYNMGVCTAYTVGDRQAGIVINNSSGDAYGFYVGWNNVTASQSNGGVSLSITYETT